MAEKKPRKKFIRPTYKQAPESVLQADIKARLQLGSPFFDYLSEIRLDDIEADGEYERGIREGMRRLARFLQDIALSEQVEGLPDGIRPT